MNDILLQYYGTLLADCVIIAIETIGMVKFLDNFIFPKRNLRLREMCFLELLTCMICAYVNSTYVSDSIGDICNLFILSLALTQLAYDCIIHGVPKFLEKLFGSSINRDNVTTCNNTGGEGK